jgi:hypothetical protein
MLASIEPLPGYGVDSVLGQQAGRQQSTVGPHLGTVRQVIDLTDRDRDVGASREPVCRQAPQIGNDFVRLSLDAEVAKQNDLSWVIVSRAAERWVLDVVPKAKSDP